MGQTVDVALAHDTSVVDHNCSNPPKLPFVPLKVFDRTFSIEVESQTRINGKFCVDRINVDSPQAAVSPKALTSDKDRRIPLLPENTLYPFRRPVAIVYFQETDGTETNCTVFAITARAVVTNNHCISDQTQLRNARILFAYEFDMQTPIERRALSIAVPTNERLDYTILELDTSVPAEFVAHLSLNQVAANQPLVLIQHPENSRKMIVTQGCSVKRVDSPGTAIKKSDFDHLCDSSGGSSGSPVMDLKGRVVGLHHLGRYADDNKYYYNMAVKMNVLLSDIATTPKGREILKDAIIDR